MLTTLFAVFADSSQLYGIGTSTSSASRGRQSGGTARRRSAVLMNLQLNDPAIPAPGEMQNTLDSLNPASPISLSQSPTAMGGENRHFRAPSLGEMHQELEQEQEAQVVGWCAFSPSRLIFVESATCHDQSTAAAAPAAPNCRWSATRGFLGYRRFHPNVGKIHVVL